MHVREALDRLDAIHDHLARAEEYRGFRTAAVALTGALGLMAAAVEPLLAGPGAEGFVVYWVAVAAVGAAVSGGPALFAHARTEDDFARRRTRRVLGQFLPCVLAGGAVAAGFVRGGPDLVAFLPGVWAVVFGLGVVAARPFLPPGVALVGPFYLLAGCLLVGRPPAAEQMGWAVSGVFGVGHLGTALALAGGRKEGCDDA